MAELVARNPNGWSAWASVKALSASLVHRQCCCSQGSTLWFLSFPRTGEVSKPGFGIRTRISRRFGACVSCSGAQAPMAAKSKNKSEGI